MTDEHIAISNSCMNGVTVVCAMHAYTHLAFKELRSGPIRKVGGGGAIRFRSDTKSGGGGGGPVRFRSDIRKVGWGHSASGPIPLFGTQKIYLHVPTYGYARANELKKYMPAKVNNFFVIHMLGGVCPLRPPTPPPPKSATDWLL